MDRAIGRARPDAEGHHRLVSKYQALRLAGACGHAKLVFEADSPAVLMATEKRDVVLRQACFQTIDVN